MALAANRARFAFHIAGCEDELRVLRFNGTEAIAGLFDWTIEVVSRNPALKLKQLLGCDALLQIDPDSGPLQKPRLVHGTVRAAVQFQASRRWTYYRIHLAPRLYWLGLRHNLRIFQNLSAPEILQQLLTEAGFDTASYRFELTRTYQPRPYCVQYNESELNFLQRLLSDEGIHYHFEHREDRHVLVIGDHGGSFRPLKGSPFKLRNDVQMVGEPVILQFTPSCKVSVDAVTRNDYDFRRPQHSLLSEARDTPAPRLEHYAWPGNYNDLDQGLRRTQDLLAAHQVNQHQAHGKSVISQLIAGTSFCLTHHPSPTLNRDWLLLSVHHQGEQPQVLEEEAPDQQGSSYSNQFQAMPADLPYRPPVGHNRPLIRGIQTAVVVGPPGEQIYTDEHGRIQVRFHWDRDGKHGRSGGAVWLRLVQSWAGSFWGSQILPRVGQEVIVNFLHGDPDQPVVSGCLYHGLHKPPYPLPEHKSRTLLRSQSLTGQGGHELMLEDASGREKIAVHSHRDLELHVTRNATAAIDRHAQTRVGGNSFSAIQGTQHCTVEGERRTRIDGDDSLTVDAALHLKAGTNIHHQAGQEIHLKAGGSLFIDAGMELSLTAGASALSLNPAGVFLNGPAINLNSGGGAGSAKAAAPKMPTSPLRSGEKKTGQGSSSTPNTKASSEGALSFTQFNNHTRNANPATTSQEALTLCCSWAGGEGLPDVPYSASLSDGTVITGTLDSEGTQTLTGLPAGIVEVEFGEPVNDEELNVLRSKVRQELTRILEAEQSEAAEIDREYQQKSSFGKGLAHAASLGSGIWNGLVGFVSFAVDTAQLVSPAGHLSRVLSATWNASKSESDASWLSRFKTAYTEEQKEDLVAVLGFDPSAISREDIAQAYEITNLVMEDPETRQLFIDFAKELSAAQHSTEWSEIGGGLIFEIILTALLAAVTAGAGAAISAGSKVRHTDKLKQLLPPLMELADKLKQRRLNQHKTGNTGGKVEASIEKPSATPLTVRLNGDYEPHPLALENGPKTGDTIYKRLHQHGDANDPYTFMPDGKPLGASAGKLPSALAGLDELPSGYANYVREGWPDLNYEYAPGRFATDYANFSDIRPVVIPKGTKIYRIVDEASQDSGAYWAYELPANKTAWRRDFAVKDSWNDNGYYVEYVVEEPEGLKAWVGRTAGQEYREFQGKEFYLEGGKEQIFITPGSIKPSLPKLTNWPDA